MAFCLIPQKVEAFRQALKEKEISLEDLLNMSTEDRTVMLKDYAGDNAKDVNTLIEQKLILKNRLLGIQNAISKLGEFGKYDKEKQIEVAKAVADYKAKQTERIFSPKEHEAFLNDLADKRMGTSISKDEAQGIFTLSKKAEDLKQNFNTENETWKNDGDGIKYGAAKVALDNYVSELKTPKASVGSVVSDFKQAFSENKVGAIAGLLGKTLKVINDNTISLVATLDNSFIGRQGLNTLMTHPAIWWEGAKTSFINMAKELGGQNAMDATMARIYSEPNYLNGAYEKAKLLPKTEEQYPNSIWEKVPVTGRVFKASEVAFKSSAVTMRTGLYDLLSNTAKENGVDIKDDVFIKDLGKMVNSLTARGEGKVSSNEVTRLVLWAPKMLKGNLDVLTAHGLGAGLKTSFARKQALMNLTKIAGEVVGTAVLLNAVRPGTVETNPQSSDFLKIKVNNTRIDALTAGKGSIITLLARLLTGKTKSTTTGKVTELNSGKFGAPTMFDVGMDFLVNKTTPPARTIIDYLRGTDANFQKTTVMGEIMNKAPISIQNFYKVNNDYTTWAIIGNILDLGGINSNTYTPIPKKK
jgi:hypothetical protein